MKHYRNVVFYRPQRSCGQGNIFTRMCLSTGGCLTHCMLGHTHPPGPKADTPRGNTPRSRHNPPPPRSRHNPPPPRSRHPQKQTPPGSRHHPQPQKQTPPPPEADTPLAQVDTPSRSRHPTEADVTPAYGQCAAGTHPTGMHSCYFFSYYTKI